MKKREFNLQVSGAIGQAEKEKGKSLPALIARVEELEAALRAAPSLQPVEEVKLTPQDEVLLKAFLTKNMAALVRVELVAMKERGELA